MKNKKRKRFRMDIREKAERLKEYPADLESRLYVDRLTSGYTDDERIFNHYRQRPKFFPVTIVLSVIVLFLITLLFALFMGVYSLAATAFVMYVMVWIGGAKAFYEYDSDGFSYMNVGYGLGLMFLGMAGFFGAALFDESAWIWVCLAFTVMGIVANLIVSRVGDWDAFETLKGCIPFFILVAALLTNPIARVVYKSEKRAIDRQIAKYDSEFQGLASELSNLFMRSAFTANAGEYFESDIAGWIKTYKPTTNERVADTSITIELCASLDAIWIGKRRFDFERANLAKPTAGVEVMGIAMAVVNTLISDVESAAKKAADGSRYSLSASYTTRKEGEAAVVAATITYTVVNTSYEAPRSIYDAIDTDTSGKR